MVAASKQKTGRKRGNNEGNIRQRTHDGRWEARVTLPNGQRKSYMGKTRKEVADKMAVALRDLHRGLPIPIGRETFGQFLDRWLRDVVKPSVRPGTYESYEQKVRVHIKPALGKWPLDQVTPQRIQAFMNEKREAGQSPRSVQYLRAIIRRALSQALKWDLVTRNAATLVDPPRLKRREASIFSAEQARTLLDALKGDRLEPLVMLTLATGLRRGEVLGLRWADVDLDAGTLTVRGQYQRMEGVWTFVEPKSDTSRRALALPGFVIAALRTHRTRQLEERLSIGSEWEDYGLVFPTATGAPQDGSSLSHQFAKRVKRAGLPAVPFHGLRHSVATLLLAKGLTLGEIQKVLGHSQISLTANLYAHAAPEIAQRAADTMDAVFGTG
ncbi:MAG: tyrosine-type recombinase/integrase [Dehalococcoidia bacterium]